jgi:hypothetical protein
MRSTSRIVAGLLIDHSEDSAIKYAPGLAFAEMTIAAVATAR